tara:strand:+ start:1518 stop:2018 length:501 start_codon:yes stop_codon:yes gene_type:complete
MKRLLIPFLLLATPVNANFIHRITTSGQTSLDNAFSTSQRGASTYSVSGTNIQVGTGNSDVFGGLTPGSNGSAATQKAHANYKIHQDGSAFSFQESFLGGDAIQSNTSVANGTVGSLPAWTTTTTGAGGHTAGVITLTSEHLVTGAGGGPGSDVIIQTVSELSVLK